MLTHCGFLFHTQWMADCMQESPAGRPKYKLCTAALCFTMCRQLPVLQMNSSAASTTLSPSKSDMTFPASRHQASCLILFFTSSLRSAVLALAFISAFRSCLPSSGASGTTTSPVPSDYGKVTAGVGISLSYISSTCS